jgi:DNA replication protein DnaC
MNDDLDQLLTSLKMHRTREVLARELDRAVREKPAYDTFLANLLREECVYKRQKSLEYRIEHARMPELWTIETFPFDQQPAVSAPVVKLLAGLDFVATGHNLVFIGPAGVGKTGLATGILYRALVNGYRGRFIRAQDLFDEINASLLDRSSRRVLNELCGYTLLCIDELGYLNLKPEQTNIFFKLMEERYTAKKPTIITTNLDFEQWYDFLGQKAMVQALLDRVRHRCHTVRIDGTTLRSPTG